MKGSMKKLLACGLTAEQTAAVRVRAPDVEVERLAALPARAPEGLLIVSAAKMDEFAQWAEERMREEGIQPRPVLLYLPVGVQEPDEAWEYYDGAVSDEDWTALDTLLECPRVLDAELAAADVRAHFLRDYETAQRPFRTVAEIPFGDVEWDKSDSEMRQHLATCVTCRAAFNEALERRRLLNKLFRK